MNKWIAGLSGMAAGLLLSGSVFACNTLNDGEVTKVDSKQNQVVVAKGDKTSTFTTASKTKVLINGKEASLADIKAGDKVSVDYETADDVLSIKATREG